MKLVTLIGLLVEQAQQNPDADAKYYNAQTDQILDLSHVDADSVKGQPVVVLGEKPLREKIEQTKQRRAEQAKANTPTMPRMRMRNPAPADQNLLRDLPGKISPN